MASGSIVSVTATPTSNLPGRHTDAAIPTLWIATGKVKNTKAHIFRLARLFVHSLICGHINRKGLKVTGQVTTPQYCREVI